MSGSTERMRQKIERTADLGSIVRTMRALSASNISQYEDSVRALAEYYRTILLGLSICLRGQEGSAFQNLKPGKEDITGVLVFGSDLGLVGQFNELLAEFVTKNLAQLPGQKKIWAVGERIYLRLLEEGLPVVKMYRVPNSVYAITPLIGQLLIESRATPFYIFHNRPKTGATYEQVLQRLLPLDEDWMREMTKNKWITNQAPEVLGRPEDTLSALIREYLFGSLFKACAESLAAENTSRLAAMQRAEKNIADLLENLLQTYHRLRQSSIDEELFDIISGFEGQQSLSR